MTLTPDLISAVERRLLAANQALAREFPGDPPSRQPVHSFYGGANLFTPHICQKLGKIALRALDEHGPFPGIADQVLLRVREKLITEPIEDYRIDFEDGYGNRPDAEEDAHAAQAASQVAEALRDGLLPPFIGIRIKPFTEGFRTRAIRTLDIFLTTLLERTSGTVAPNFVVALPKAAASAHVTALADLFDIFELQRQLPANSLKCELMIETPQAMLCMAAMVEAARGRCIAAHLGPYDYSGSLGVTAAHQTLLHPACEFARQTMKAALTSRGVWLADGPTNVMPIGDGDTVRRAWKLHFDHVRHALGLGFYQGWDLHPAQLPSRYAAVYSFFLEGLEEATARLRSFRETGERATMTGDIFDDAATGLGLTNYFRRAINCGALDVGQTIAFRRLSLSGNQETHRDSTLD